MIFNVFLKFFAFIKSYLNFCEKQYGYGSIPGFSASNENFSNLREAIITVLQVLKIYPAVAFVKTEGNIELKTERKAAHSFLFFF